MPKYADLIHTLVQTLDTDIERLDALVASLAERLDASVASLAIDIDALRADIDALLPAPEPTLPTPDPEPEPEPDITFPHDATLIEDQLFRDSDTALLLVGSSVGPRIYRRCTFEGGRYALWMDHQEDITFEFCFFRDNVDRSPNPPGWGQSDECCVRIEDCDRIRFWDCKIEAHGSKHAFRAHGVSDEIIVDGMTVVSEGNGVMIGRYLGGPPASITNLVLSDVTVDAHGPDTFDIKRDGSVIAPKILDVRVTYYPSSGGWDAAGSIAASHPADWYVVDLLGENGEE